jgi:hypothetical protein
MLLRTKLPKWLAPLMALQVLFLVRERPALRLVSERAVPEHA